MRYMRTEKFYKLERNQQKGSDVYLQRRAVKGFERMMLKMGGAEILRTIGGKTSKVKAERVEFVYQWVDPGEPVLVKPKQFLLARTKEQFEEMYTQEVAYQELSIKNSGDATLHIEDCLFTNELLQLFELFRRSARDKEHTFGTDFLSSLPKSLRAYMEDINFEEFELLPVYRIKQINK